MFIRKRKDANSNKTRIQICESVRDGARVVQKTLKQVGVANNEREIIALTKAAEYLIHEMETDRRGGSLFDDFETLQAQASQKPKKSKTQVHVEDLREVEQKVEGPVDIFGFASQEMRLDEIAPKGKNELLKNLIAARICSPNSKRGTHRYLEEQAGFECSLDSIYRLLDHLCGKQEQIIQKVSSAAAKLFDSKIDLMFFDVTTLYFESWNQDELKDFGFSKDCKFGQVQVTLALATQENGFPVGYKLFPGNTAEVSTLIKCVNGWRGSIDIRDVVFVADRGMFSAKNLEAITKAGFKFVVGCPLRKLGKQVEKKILDETPYQLSPFGNNKEAIWHASFDHRVTGSEKDPDSKEKITYSAEGRIVVTFSTKRAIKDRSDREVLIDKAKKKYEKKSKSTCPTKLKDLLGNRGYTKYLKLTEVDSARVEVDADKIERDSRWDGMSGVFTNSNMRNLEVLSRYRGLWQIEECFRISKTNVKIRPIFHYTPDRIQGHVALCFLSLAVLKYTQTKVSTEEQSVSTHELIRELNGIRATTVEDKVKKIRFKVPSKLTNLGRHIYKSFGKRRSESTKPIE
jgi:transposase/cell fate (sporulation/competence/biofilm development) regulator YlbF (YheA/YmcA/DUF963 family)